MKYSKAILLGTLNWVLIFFEVSILMFGFQLQSGQFYYYLFHFPLLAAITLLSALLYFRKTRPSAGAGALLGIIFILTGLVLDAAITIPLFIKSYAFFLDPALWAGYLEGIVVTTIVSLALKK